MRSKGVASPIMTKTRYTNLLHRLSHILLCTFLALCSSVALFSWSSATPHAHAATMRSGNDTILLVHGFAPTPAGRAINCSASGSIDGFGEILDYLKRPHPINGQNIAWHRQDFRTIGYYAGDSNCSENLHYDTQVNSKCNGYPGWNPTSTYGTSNESIYHISCELAWYIYNNFGVYSGWNIEIVAHSMGGLIVRNMIYQVQQKKAPEHFPPTLGNISDIVTLESPHEGIGGDSLTRLLSQCGNCTEVNELANQSYFMNEMQNNAQNPQAKSGTDWTLIGSECDVVSYNTVSTWMDGGHKVRFRNNTTGAPCYDHEGILMDENDASDAVVSWSNGQARNSNYWINWAQAPHSLRYMMHALWFDSW